MSAFNVVERTSLTLIPMDSDLTQATKAILELIQYARITR